MTRTESPHAIATGSVVAVPLATVVANATSYVLVLVAAHAMTSADYGALSSLLGLLLLLAGVPMLALQTVTARRIAAGERQDGLVRGTAVVAVSATVGLALASPLLSDFLHLHSPMSVLLVAASIPPTAVAGTAMGCEQGRREFARLASLILLTTGGRSLGGLAGVLVHRSPEATLVGVLVGSSLAAAVAAARTGDVARYWRAARTRARAGVVLETAHAAHAHAAFLLVASLDVLLARHVLGASAAGVYAVGAIVTRAALWLPQSVVTVLFASLATEREHGAGARRAVLAVGAVSLAIVAGTAAFGHEVVLSAGGRRYASLDHVVWLFAALGALLALVQLAVLAGLARRRIRRTILLWGTAAADCTVALAAANLTPARLITLFVGVTSVAAAVAVTITLRPARRSDTVRQR